MKKLLAMLLSVLMLVSCCALAVSAEDNIYNDTEMDWSALMGSFVVGSAEAKPGDTIVIPVSIEKNPGIVSLKLAVTYDATVLELVEAAAGDFVVAEQEDITIGSPSFGPVENNPFTINWMDALATENNTKSGVIANLTFKVKEGAAEGDTSISLSYNPNDVFDWTMNNVEFAMKSGTVTVAAGNEPGDVNGDGKINLKDLGVLQQYLNKWEVEIDLDAAEVTGDDKVNLKDLGVLQQYLNKWDVELV